MPISHKPIASFWTHQTFFLKGGQTRQDLWTSQTRDNVRHTSHIGKRQSVGNIFTNSLIHLVLINSVKVIYNNPTARIKMNAHSPTIYRIISLSIVDKMTKWRVLKWIACYVDDVLLYYPEEDPEISLPECIILTYNISISGNTHAYPLKLKI